MVLAGSFQYFSVSRDAPDSGITTMSAGRRWEKVPTSRAVPQADGWPVSEKAPSPGLHWLPGQQVVHVALLVDPGAALVLVEAHGPVRHDLAVRSQ
jgi:hypothetical protein